MKESLQFGFSEEGCNKRAILFCLSFLGSPLEDMDDVTIKLRCSACNSGPGLLKWYNWVLGLIEHARGDQLEMVNVHREIAELLETFRSSKITLMSNTMNH